VLQTRDYEFCAHQFAQEHAGGEFSFFGLPRWSREQSPERCVDVLSELFERTARAPVQGGLQEMRVLFELLGFLLAATISGARLRRGPSC
jgi:hypothetical protein